MAKEQASAYFHLVQNLVFSSLLPCRNFKTELCPTIWVPDFSVIVVMVY
jgi:hypothetical protein